jgi:histidinol dehydrogenase
MAYELDNILIEYSKKNEQTINAVRSKICETAAAFDFRSPQGIKVAEIIEDVRKRGDAAVSYYTQKFDNVKLSPSQFRVTNTELKKAHNSIDTKLLSSIRKAIVNAKKYQKKIFIGTASKSFGSTGIRYTLINRVAICIPGASAPLPSTVIATAVAAKVAGVKEIVIISPPRCNGNIHPATLAVCYELGINEVYRIGGVQAVAALTSGIETIKSADMIIGPGNQWVQTAKRLICGRVKIDYAGPSEVLIIADDKANPAYLAADMLSQAEHAPGSALLFTPSKKLAAQVIDELAKQINLLDRSEKTLERIKEFSAIIVFKNIEQCIEWANKFATEHLQIQCGSKNKQIAKKIENAGAIFLGEYSPVATGDYFAGPSHTLPTGGCAKFASALTCNDFLKSISIIEYDKKMLTKSADDIIRLAETEGLDAHAKSIRIRVKK